MNTSLRAYSLHFLLFFTAILLSFGCNASSSSKSADGAQKEKPAKSAKRTAKKSKEPTQKEQKKNSEDSKKTTPKAPKKLPKPENPGAAFTPPASQAVLGIWDVRVSDKYVPKGVDKIDGGLAGLTRGTLKFDGSTAVLDIMGQAEARKYTVLREDENVLALALGDTKEVAITVTFLDHDNIFVEDKGRGELTGRRQGAKGAK